MSGMTSPGGKSRDTTAACLGNPPAKTPCTRSLLVAWKGAVGHRSANDGGGQSIRRHGEAPWAPQAPALNPACSRRFFSSTRVRWQQGAAAGGGGSQVRHPGAARRWFGRTRAGCEKNGNHGIISGLWTVVRRWSVDLGHARHAGRSSDN